MAKLTLSWQQDGGRTEYFTRTYTRTVSTDDYTLADIGIDPDDDEDDDRSSTDHPTADELREYLEDNQDEATDDYDDFDDESYDYGDSDTSGNYVNFTVEDIRPDPPKQTATCRNCGRMIVQDGFAYSNGPVPVWKDLMVLGVANPGSEVCDPADAYKLRHTPREAA